MNEDNEIQIVPYGVNGYRSWVRGLSGRTGVWGYPSYGRWVYAHEAGHLMGADDHYKDNKNGFSEADEGWGNNLYGDGSFGIDGRSLDEIAKAQGLECPESCASNEGNPCMR